MCFYAERHEQLTQVEQDSSQTSLALIELAKASRIFGRNHGTKWFEPIRVTSNYPLQTTAIWTLKQLVSSSRIRFQGPYDFSGESIYQHPPTGLLHSVVRPLKGLETCRVGRWYMPRSSPAVPVQKCLKWTASFWAWLFRCSSTFQTAG